MKKDLYKKSMLSLVLAGAALFSAAAGAEISAQANAAGQGSAAANGTINNSDTGNARIVSSSSATAAGDVDARVNDGAIRASVARNGSAAAQAGVDAAHNTVVDVKKSGHVIRQEEASASESV